MLTPREKSPLLKKFSPEEDRTYNAASIRTVSLTHYQPASPAPVYGVNIRSKIWLQTNNHVCLQMHIYIYIRTKNMESTHKDRHIFTNTHADTDTHTHIHNQTDGQTIMHINLHTL